MIDDLFAALQDNLNRSDWDFQLGEEFLNEQSNPPRIVLYPVVESYEVPSQRNVRVAATNTSPKRLEKHLQRRTVYLEAALWGSDYRQIEDELLPEFLTALATATDDNYVLGQGRWFSSGGQFQESGRILYLPFSTAVAIKAPDRTLGVVTEIIYAGFLEPKPEQDF